MCLNENPWIGIFQLQSSIVVMMGTYGKLGLFKRPGKKEKELSMESLEKVGMTGFANRQISELSGGTASSGCLLQDHLPKMPICT